jgi:cyclase
MLKRRIIPILTSNGFTLVKTKQFKNPRTVGNPIQTARVFNLRNVDELVFIDIMATKQNRKQNLLLLKNIIKECYMPVAIGGGIKTLFDIEQVLRIGADKVVIASSFYDDIDFVKEAIDKFGSQCINVALDVYKSEHGYCSIKDNTPIDKLIEKVNSLKIGEVILTSVDYEGKQNGFDDELYSTYAKNFKMPLIINGGASKPSDFGNKKYSKYVSGYGASSIYVYTEFTPLDIKIELKRKNIPTRITSANKLINY